MEQRRFTRIPYNAKLYYISGPDAGGIATCRDVSRGGVHALTGQALTPGSHVLLLVANVLDCPTPLEVKTRVAWRRPSPDGDRYDVGFTVLFDGPETCEAVSQILCEAVYRMRDIPETDREHSPPAPPPCCRAGAA